MRTRTETSVVFPVIPAFLLGVIPTAIDVFVRAIPVVVHDRAEWSFHDVDNLVTAAAQLLAIAVSRDRHDVSGVNSHGEDSATGEG